MDTLSTSGSAVVPLAFPDRVVRSDHGRADRRHRHQNGSAPAEGLGHRGSTGAARPRRAGLGGAMS